jgi:hypothetical protein
MIRSEREDEPRVRLPVRPHLRPAPDPRSNGWCPFWKRLSTPTPGFSEFAHYSVVDAWRIEQVAKLPVDGQA